MKALILILALLFSALSAPPALASDQNDPLADWQWNKRLLVLCLPNDEEIIPEKTIIIYQNADWFGFEERDLLFVELRKNEIHTVTGSRENNWNVWRRDLHDESRSELREGANCKYDFEFVLFGKDGGVKKRWQNYVSFVDLYATIDAMPMRQREMREQGE